MNAKTRRVRVAHEEKRGMGKEIEKAKEVRKLHEEVILRQERIMELQEKKIARLQESLASSLESQVRLERIVIKLSRDKRQLIARLGETNEGLVNLLTEMKFEPSQN